MFISIDGAAATEVNLYDDSLDTLFKETVFSAEQLTNATHIVEITTQGQSVYIDSFSIDGKIQ